LKRRALAKTNHGMFVLVPITARHGDFFGLIFNKDSSKGFCFWPIDSANAEADTDLLQ
jgi:hypothetical protein